MIKVIGQDPKLVKQISCINCGAVLEYHNSDVLEHSAVDYSGSSAGYTYIKCPQCNNRVIIKSW